MANDHPSDDGGAPTSSSVVRHHELYGNLIGTNGSFWINDQTVFDYLCLKLPESLVIDPLVFHPNYNVDKNGISGSRADQGCGTIIMPVQYKNHWILCTFELPSLIVIVYDTLRQDIPKNVCRRVERVAEILVQTFPQDPKLGLPRGNDSILIVDADYNSYSHQFDLQNCGPLVCMMACAYYNQKPLHFNESETEVWRREAFKFLVENEKRIPTHRIKPAETKKCDT
uniref:ULP_PROTEASE domain-containing protein n=1 Tax=Steinernema glaseri TaxID=37863 RepID=A0A1I7Z488_9BILA